MSKKKGQKHVGKPGTLSELFNAPKEERKAFMERVIEKAIARQKRTLAMANGSQVWFDECPEHEILVGTNTWDASKGEYVQENKVLRTAGGYEGAQEQFVPLPPKGTINTDGIHH